MFYSTKGENGTGLGLGMVHEIVRKHRGYVEIDSAPGHGSTFRLRLPLAMVKVDDDTELSTCLNRSLNVLLVDDDQRVRDILVQFLSQDGHRVTEASNGRDGLVSFYADQFDLIITDQAMPLVNGEQMVHSIRKKGWKGPIIMISGFADQMKDNGNLPKKCGCCFAQTSTIGDIAENNGSGNERN
jgi:CheY-like chemotaxis protein